jgi:hypothetical protein
VQCEGKQKNSGIIELSLKNARAEATISHPRQKVALSN